MKVSRSHARSNKRMLDFEMELWEIEKVTDLLSESNHVSLATELKAPVLCCDKRVKVAARRPPTLTGREATTRPIGQSRENLSFVVLFTCWSGADRFIIVSGPNKPSADFTTSSLAQIGSFWKKNVKSSRGVFFNDYRCIFRSGGDSFFPADFPTREDTLN